MLKTLLNECIFTIILEPTSPLLIKKCPPETEEERKVAKERKKEAEMKFLTIQRVGENGPTPFIPGASIKGVFRNHLERIARTLNKIGCCDPLLNSYDGSSLWEVSCSQRFQWRLEGPPKAVEREERIPGTIAYADSCPICKIFGSSFLRSRIETEDAFPIPEITSPEKLPRRTSIAIDRFTGGAKKGVLFDYEVWNWGHFQFQMRLWNFELWQLGFLAYLFRDLEAEEIRIGYGKKRGLGKVKGTIQSFALRYCNNHILEENNKILPLVGVGYLADKMSIPETRSYRFAEEEPVELKIEDWCSSLPKFKKLRFEYLVPTKSFPEIWQKVAPYWNRYISNYSIPDKMKREYFFPKEVRE